MLNQKPIAYGRTAEVYAWEDHHVLKLFYDWVSAESIVYEARIHRTVQAYFEKLPRLMDEIEIEGRKGIIFERVDGAPLIEVLFSDLTKSAGQFRQMAQLHHQLHSTELDGLPDLKQRLIRKINDVDCLSAEEKQQVFSKITELPDKNILCHFDFHPGQIMLTDQGPVVIDWVDACLGDPVADVARTMLLLKFTSSNEPGLLKRILIPPLGRWASKIYLSEMLKLNPEMTREMVFRWMVPIAAARMREGVPGDDKRVLPWLRKRLRSG